MHEELLLPATSFNPLENYFPVLVWFPQYCKHPSIIRDAVAGVTVGVIAVLQSLSYATIVGVPPVHGLYTAFASLVPYVILGSSPFLSTGPTAVMSIIVNGAVPQYWNGKGVDPTMRILLTQALAFCAGSTQIIMGLCKLGKLIDLVSEPIIHSFTSASAILIAGTQIDAILGIPKCNPAKLLGPSHEGEECLVYEIVYSIGSNISQVHANTVAGSILSFGLLLLYKRVLVHRTIAVNFGPIVLMVLNMGLFYILESQFGVVDIDGKIVDAKLGIQMVGPIAVGLPSLSNPLLAIGSFRDVTRLYTAGITIAVVGFMEAMTIAKTMETQKPKVGNVNALNELIALGHCNIVSSCFGGFPATGSFSRTAVNANTGAASQVAGLFSMITIITSLILLTECLQYIPKYVLSCIVVVSVVNLVHVSEPMRLYAVFPHDFVVFMSVFSATLFFGVAPGLLTGVLLNWVLALSTHKRITISNVDSQLDILQLSCNLTFENAASIRRRFDKCTSQYVVLDCSKTHAMDSSGLHLVDTLLESNLHTVIVCSLDTLLIDIFSKIEKHPVVKNSDGFQRNLSFVTNCSLDEIVSAFNSFI